MAFPWVQKLNCHPHNNALFLGVAMSLITGTDKRSGTRASVFLCVATQSSIDWTRVREGVSFLPRIDLSFPFLFYVGFEGGITVHFLSDFVWKVLSAQQISKSHRLKPSLSTSMCPSYNASQVQTHCRDFPLTSATVIHFNCQCD